MHGLGVDPDLRAARGVDERLEREERRADDDLHAVDRGDPRQQRLDVLLALGDRLVHLPVAGDERGPAHVRASTPGRGLPSISSSDAPPPVERWVDPVGEPELGDRRRGVAAADDRDRVGLGHRLGDRAGAGRERLQLERAHRAVPEHRARVARSPRRSPPRCGGRRRGPSSRRARRRRRAPASRCRRRTRGRRRGRRAGAACRRRRRAPARGLEALLLAQRVADVVALRLEEREAHRAADEDPVGAGQERLEHADLVGHLGAADDGDERPLADARGCR